MLLPNNPFLDFRKNDVYSWHTLILYFLNMSELKQFIENSRVNEEIAQKLFEIETGILACHSSHELLQQLLGSIKQKFNLTGILLLLIEPMPIVYLFRDNHQSVWQQANTRKISGKTLADLHPNNKPYLSNRLEHLTQQLPEGVLANAKSAALTPLRLENTLFGSLLFIDADEQRFHRQLGTVYLEQLAVKVSLCLANTLIREQLEYVANYDLLTGVANRRKMQVVIDEALACQRRYGVHFSLLFIDCNKFKQINDNYGHACGDQVLAYVAQTLCRLIRENDQCFRYAGDEFVVFLAAQDEAQAKLAATRLSDYFVNHKMPYRDDMLTVTITCGAAASDGTQSQDELLSEADKQLYCNKKSSGTSVATKKP